MFHWLRFAMKQTNLNLVAKMLRLKENWPMVPYAVAKIQERLLEEEKDECLQANPPREVAPK